MKLIKKILSLRWKVRPTGVYKFDNPGLPNIAGYNESNGGSTYVFLFWKWAWLFTFKESRIGRKIFFTEYGFFSGKNLFISFPNSTIYITLGKCFEWDSSNGDEWVLLYLPLVKISWATRDYRFRFTD